MPEFLKRECLYCKWWMPSSFKSKYGQCRKNAPVIKAENVITGIRNGEETDELIDYTIWPITKKSDYCGDWDVPEERIIVNNVRESNDEF